MEDKKFSSFLLTPTRLLSVLNTLPLTCLVSYHNLLHRQRAEMIVNILVLTHSIDSVIIMCRVSPSCLVTVVFIHTIEDDQRLNTLVHEGDTLHLSLQHRKKTIP